ncbi:cAMP-specific 3',5'-cyclic phosphodiesterase [Hondaea fermentalgiana]|uniref:cAMP-specific 3',5'-cyclic phosphodiesterase n=1 Tax=Hondaea fermentalgiana TaxID=2315210 RepID=A0A2R5GC36_9STRA|nr:cAMP-specific 3',5'-cyclic phosphodiesterase [Hondaea fermentalgiana]|eukprot:GBG28547.1 cAMP-specific 3',5'-cyclic phosphodiesterase [Hondaea fermentalgiana]
MASNDGGISEEEEEEEEEEASAGAPSGDVTVPVAYAPTPATKSRTLTRRRSALMQSTESETTSEPRMGARIVQEFAAVHLVDFVQRMLHEVDCDWDLTPFNQELETVAIFLDVSGFTKLTERLSEEGSVGSEKLGFFLNRYFERINKLLSKGGGDILKFAGDAMIIFWQAEHDQNGKLDRKLMALKATQAALQLQEELHGAELADGVEFSVKMGIGVGRASILHVGGERDRVEIVPCGEALMQAFAGENQCSPGQTVVSPEVWALVSDSFSGTKLKSGSTAVNSNTKRVRNISIKRPLLSSSHEIKQLQRYVPASIIPFLQTHLSWMTEVREVTTIFVNLGLDPHDLVATTPKRLQRVQDIFRGVQREAYRVEASVNKFIVDDKGTTVLVALGLPPLSNFADPARGVAFALRIVRVLRGLDPRGKRYIGVTTGTALCGPVGSGSRKEYTLLGDSVNVSARLMQAAKDPHTNLCKSVGYIGNIVCDESTRNACRELVHDFVFHPVGEIMLKGKTHATCCFQPGWATLHNERALIRQISSSQKLAREAPPVAETWRLRYIDVLFAVDNFFNSDGKHPAAATMFCTNAAEARETMDLTCMQLWEDRNAEPYYVLNDEVVSITELHNDFKLPTMGVPLTFSSRNSSNRSMHGSSRSSQGSGRAFNAAAKGIHGGSGRSHYSSGRSSPGSGRGMQAPKWIQHLTRQLSHTLLLRTNAFLGDSLLQGAPVWRRILQGVVALAKVREVTVDDSVLAHPCFSTWPMAYAAATFQPDETEYTFSDDDFDQVINAISALLQTMVAANFSLVLTIEDAHNMPPMDWRFTRRISEHMLSHQRDRHTRPAYQANMEVVHGQNNAEEDKGTKLEGANSIVSAQSSNKSLSGVSGADSVERKASQRDGSHARRRSSIFQQAIPFSGVFLLVSLIPPHSVARRPKSAGLEESYVGFVQSMQTIIVEHQPLTLLEANALILSHLQVTQVSAGLTKTLYRIIGGDRDRLIACLDALCAAGFVEGLASQGNPNVKGQVLRRSSSGIRLTAKRPSQNMILPEEKVRLIPMSFKQRLHALSICSDCCNTRWEAQILDRLSVAEKIVLRCASILANGLGPFGLHFDLGMLVAIYPFKEVDPDVTIMPSVEASKGKKPPSVAVDEGVLFKLETRLQRLLQIGVIKEVHRPLYTEENASAALRHEDHCPHFRVDSSAGDTFESRRGRERCFSFCDVIMRRKVYREMLLAHRKRLHQTVIQDKEWDECLENAPMESTSRENLVAFLRQNPDVEQAEKRNQHVKSSGSDRQNETQRNSNTSVGLRMRGMRWSIKTRSSNSSKVQAATTPQQAAQKGDPPMSRAASADSHLENRRKSSSFKLRIVRNTQSAEDRKRRRVSSDTVKHALFIYSDPIAVETWSRRMNFQERDALSALALQLDAWSFDIFSFERVACGTPLHMMLRLLFLKHGFYELFEFNISMVDRFAQEVERLYPANPYHNSTHAADVVQACHVFLLQLHQRKLVLRSDGEEAEVQMSSSAQDFLSASMTGMPLTNEDEDGSDDSQMGTLSARQSARDSDSPEFSKLDRLAMLLAAAVHDIGHPGVNASFLKATGNALCEQFADPVLENFHAATARPLIEALLEGELDQVKTTIQPLVTRLVLSTSVENHTAFVDKLNRRMDLLASASAHASDLQHSRCSLSTASSSPSLSDLVDMDKDAGAMMMELIIKCADVSNCARELPTYKLWVTRISEEFIGQTELERHVGVPVTTFMASFDPQMQLGFINNIAFPLFDVLARLCPEATEQRDYVMTNYSFYQKGKDTSAPGVLRTPPQSVASTQRLLQNQLMNSSSKDSKYSSETLKQSLSKINMVSSTMSRSNTASMKVRPQPRLGSTTSRSASVIFTSERMVTEMSHAKSYDWLSSPLPGAVIEEEEGVSHEQAM